MGREWLYKASSGGNGSGGGRKPPSPTTTSNPMNRKTRKEKKTSSSSSGCMTAFYNLFDIQFRFHHPSFISESSTLNNSHQSSFGLQGAVEGPSNSLDSSETAIEIPSLSSSLKVKEQKNLSIPIAGIKINTKRSRFTDDISSECSGSPGTKTPTLVARLMGLDILPEYSSPRSSASSTAVNSHHRSRSLPVTPRLSTASRRSTDSDYQHRLSLQFDKENSNVVRRRPEVLVNRQDATDDDRKTQYAKQIANQVRERINRRLGTDITNTVSRRDSDLVLLKPKKPPIPATIPAPVVPVKAKRNDTTPFSTTEKLRLLDIKNNLNKPISILQSLSVKDAEIKPKAVVIRQKPPLIKLEKPVKNEKFKRIESERYDLNLKKKKSIPLQNHVVNVKNTTKFLSFKKEMTSSSSTTRLPQKQVSLVSMTHLPSNLNSLSYNTYDSHPTTTTSATTGGDGQLYDHFNYISRILNHCEIHPTTPISTGQWYSPSHPLQPSIFHRLEKLHHPTTTSAAAAAGRRMIFELVDELLAEILKPCMNKKPWVLCSPPPDSICGSELIGKLCWKVGSFPAANCEVLEDIDGLIENDMGRSMRRLLTTAFEAEVEEIVEEIEGEIVETLVHEMTVAPARSDRLR